jgi:hypothetical protein
VTPTAPDSEQIAFTTTGGRESDLFSLVLERLGIIDRI